MLKLKYMKKYLVLFAFFVFVFFPQKNALALSPSIGFSVTPESVSPGDLVTIKLNSFSTDLNRSNIVWTVDGAVVLDGVGKTEYSLTAKGLGEQTKVEVTINTTNGIPVLKTIFINPQSADILWEAIDSYTPPFYKGKALPSREALIKTSVVPFLKGSRGSLSNPNALVYNWEQNYKPYPNLSGYGKSFYVFRNTFLTKEEVVKVKVSTTDGTLTAASSAKITFFDPEILFYEKKPAIGTLFNRAKNDGISLVNEETSIVGVPFFYSTKTKAGVLDGTLSLSWEINGSTVPSEKPDTITVRKQEGESGYSILNFSVKGPYLYQKGASSVRISF